MGTEKEIKGVIATIGVFLLFFTSMIIFEIWHEYEDFNNMFDEFCKEQGHEKVTYFENKFWIKDKNNIYNLTYEYDVKCDGKLFKNVEWYRDGVTPRRVKK